MTHIIHAPGVEEANRLDPNCDDCRQKVVGNLDQAHFAALMGCSRTTFEKWCRNIDTSDYSRRTFTLEGEGPYGLYNFWDAIMGTNALQVQTRKDELDRRRAREEERREGHMATDSV